MCRTSTNTAPVEPIGPYPQWADPAAIVSLDPWGPSRRHRLRRPARRGLGHQADHRRDQGAYRHARACRVAIAAGRLRPDGKILRENGSARRGPRRRSSRFWLPAGHRQALRRRRGGSSGAASSRTPAACSPSWLTRPPISRSSCRRSAASPSISSAISAPSPIPARHVACRVHDECNGSDVFGSDICTCRPYLAHGIEVCIATAQEGGCGFIVYNRKEGRALGEGHQISRLQCAQAPGMAAIAPRHISSAPNASPASQDMRFQELMPDVLHWARRHPHRPLRLDERHQVQADRRERHHGRRARRDPRRPHFPPMPASRWMRRRRRAISPKGRPRRWRSAKGRGLEGIGVGAGEVAAERHPPPPTLPPPGGGGNLLPYRKRIPLPLEGGREGVGVATLLPRIGP